MGSQRDLRGFLKLLEERGQLRRITAPVDPDLELAAIADRVLSAGGPALRADGLDHDLVLGHSAQDRMIFLRGHDHTSRALLAVVSMMIDPLWIRLSSDDVSACSRVTML